MSTHEPRPDRPHEPVDPSTLRTDGARHDGTRDHDETAVQPRPSTGEHRADVPPDSEPARDHDETRVEHRAAVPGRDDHPHHGAHAAGAAGVGAAAGAAAAPTARTSERPTTDPHGPGTTFFTNHPDDVLARERDAYGGVKVGSAFFGWLSAVGLLALLLALLSALGAAFGLAEPGAVGDAVDSVQNAEPTTIGIVSAVVLVLALFLAYFAGGYVAGRMARFDGAKQGVAVWLWAVVVAVVVAVLGFVAGDRFDVLAQLGGFPRIPVNEGDLTTAGIVAAVVAALVPLLGAVLGGIAGARYHRKVDRVGLLDEPQVRERA